MVEQFTEEQREETLEELRRTFRFVADVSIVACKQSDPVASIIFDGIGLLTAGNVQEVIKSAVSIVDTANNMTDSSTRQTYESKDNK